MEGRGRTSNLEHRTSNLELRLPGLGLRTSDFGLRTSASIHGRDDRGEGFSLRRVQRQRLAGQNVLARVRVALGNLRSDRDQAPVFQAADRRRRGLRQCQQFAQRQFAPFFKDAPDFLLPLGQFRQFAGDRQGADMKPLAPVGLLVADGLGQDAFQRRLRRAAVVIADPARELEDLGRDERLRADDFEDGLEPGVRRLLGQPGHAPQHFARAERDLDTAADVNLVRQFGRDEVIELLAERDFQGNAGNHVCWSLSTTFPGGFQ